MKDTFYFSHDYNTRSDDKIKSLIRKHGVIGYGIFWCIIEDLYNNANALRTDYEGIAYDLRADVFVVKSVINDFDLFVFDDEFFGSISVQRRLEDRSAKSLKARESALYRWNKKDTDANAMRTQCDSNAIKERKVKESKGDEIKEKKEKNKKKIFTPPTLLDVISYFSENGYSELSAKKAFQYYEAANWHDSNDNQVKNWKQKMIAVWFKDENKVSQPTPQSHPNTGKGWHEEFFPNK